MNDMNTHRFTLDTSSKKHLCPGCEKRRFTYYIDNETGQPVSETVGRCDREENCGYHFTPREYIESGGEVRPGNTVHVRPPLRKKPGRLSFDIVHDTVHGRSRVNALIDWMSTLPGWSRARADRVRELYHIGTGSKAVQGWTIFWQIDERKEVRSGKLIKYDQATGRRSKGEGYSYDWIHTILIRSGMLPDDETQWSLQQCLFGLHLIADNPGKPIAIVESEKTAIIASEYLPDFIWLATGTINGLNVDKLKPLKGRKVVLFPDKGKAFTEWTNFTKGYQRSIKVSDLLERKAPGEHDGYDIADYLVQFDIEQFPGAKPFPYPPDWDEVEPPEPGTAEYNEATLLIMRELGADIDHTVTADEINAFWQKYDSAPRERSWRTTPVSVS